jgi:hypothetical protein
MALTLSSTSVATRADSQPDLTAIKTYLLKQCTALKDSATALKTDSDTFYALAHDAQFDYAALWKNHQADVIKSIQAAQQDWIALNPQYERMEGIVAGVPFLTKYDPILDSGVKGQVDLDVQLPDGRQLAKPGNLMALTQETLWGTEKTFVLNMTVDFNGNGTQDFGEVMPDAQYLKGFADAMVTQTSALYDQASKWTPTDTDVFTALVINLPTMTDFFNAWKDSRFVLGDKATRADFAVTSRLSDIHDNVSSWQVMWQGLSPEVEAADSARNQAISAGLSDLKTYIDDLYNQEQGGKRFTPEQADLFSSEAQNRATLIVGQISQVAAELNITLPQGQ